MTTTVDVDMVGQAYTQVSLSSRVMGDSCLHMPDVLVMILHPYVWGGSLADVWQHHAWVRVDSEAKTYGPAGYETLGKSGRRQTKAGGSFVVADDELVVDGCLL